MSWNPLDDLTLHDDLRLYPSKIGGLFNHGFVLKAGRAARMRLFSISGTD